MKVRKEQLAGTLYTGVEYAAGILRGQNTYSKRQRKRITSEAKRKINAMQRKWHLMQLLNCNFESGQDIFLYLGYADEVDADTASKALKNFHKAARRVWARYGEPYKYICITETHSKDGEDARLHHHLILSGLPIPALRIIERLWQHGSVDVRTLRELTDNFEDTCTYLLKEKKDANKRAYSTSHNLEKPETPIRRHVRETDNFDTPPGVKVVRYDKRDTAFGGYTVLIGRIYDMDLFLRYWSRAKAKPQILARPRKTRWALQHP